ncbi:MAG: hypothetical protein CME64_04700 [Halobacteriovoraceae bacterium]|nr:hypothetical protein [Halobacteriovoraceae bacterium]|tara:strand:+ start:231721 stop:232038 length:318 start_codon:yes stop_codon:yes gene_type:complete
MPTVSLIHKNLQFYVEEGEILFDALDNQGEKLPHGCLAGSCGACRIEVTEGAQNLKAPSAVEQNTVESIKEHYESKNGKGSLENRVVRLACRARVFGDVSVKPLK